MRIILGITGSIAAYKAAVLTRLLIKHGHDVQVLMTEAAAGFISPLTLSTLSKKPVHHQIHTESGWNNHVSLGLWADLMVVAPCTANTLAKMAHGTCDNLLTAVYLSARCPVWVAPAMDEDMWNHPATRDNLQRLQQRGVELIPVGTGELASGLSGPGRMAEPEEILALLERFAAGAGALTGRRVLITAGPTREIIDPVRYIGNRSTGKMGIALAEVAAEAGAAVSLVLGPTHLNCSHPQVHTILVETAEEMYQACRNLSEDSDIIILAAAVADFRPSHPAASKIKKRQGAFSQIEVEPTTDIAATLGKIKKPAQTIVGFALETNDELHHARAKCCEKNMDFIVLNSLNDPGAGFGHDTNKITLVFEHAPAVAFPLTDKKTAARNIVAQILRVRGN
jgi:phosphopantothenoylcysteine decarboxylase/phosphopantothenate--cysteine ligase